MGVERTRRTDAASVDPASVIEGLYAAMNAHNVDAALGFFAGDAVRTELPPPPGSTGRFTGLEENRGQLNRSMAANIHGELSNLLVDGDNVAWTAKVSVDRWRQLNLGALDFDGAAVVQGGKIKSWTNTMSAESQARLQAALKSAQPAA
jgi:hypothetical protein